MDNKTIVSVFVIEIYVDINFCDQIRRQARLRREYLFRKAQEEQKRAVNEKKQQIKRSLDGH